MVKPVKPTPFKLNIENWGWSEEVESLMNKLRDNIASDIIEGTEFGLDAWLTDYVRPDVPHGDTLHLQVYVYDEAIGKAVAEKNFSLTELFEALDLDPTEVDYRREKFQRLAEEFETLAKRIRGLLDQDVDRDAGRS